MVVVVGAVAVTVAPGAVAVPTEVAMVPREVMAEAIEADATDIRAASFPPERHPMYHK